MFEKNNTTFTLNVLYEKEMEMCPDYISKTRIVKKEVKTALLKGITSKHDGHSYFMNCPHFFRTKSKL